MRHKWPSATFHSDGPLNAAESTSRLIVNADDFGLTRGVNRAIADLYRTGALSSTTLMANGDAFADAVELVRELPNIGVGCHIVLTDGRPLSEPNKIPSLLGKDRRSLRPSLAAFARAAVLGRLDQAEIELEAGAQVSRLIENGIRPTHLDSHKHTHMFPVVLRALLRVADCFSIPALRNPFEQRWSVNVGRGQALRRLQVRLLRLLESNFHAEMRRFGGRIQTTRGAIGVSATGDLDEMTLGSLLEKLPPGTWEFVCHPGFCDEDLRKTTTRLLHERDIEREALLKFVPRHEDRGSFELVSFSVFADGSAAEHNGTDVDS